MENKRVQRPAGKLSPSPAFQQRMTRIRLSNVFISAPHFAIESMSCLRLLAKFAIALTHNLQKGEQTAQACAIALFSTVITKNQGCGTLLTWLGKELTDHEGDEYPLVVFALSFVVLVLAAATGDTLRNWVSLKEEDREQFGVILGATLTLLALLIGFSFSMATSRYDQRKNYEEAEANAIGTEYVRADLLPAAEAAKVRELLKKYTDQRVLFYTTRNPSRVAKINADTAKLQDELWATVRPGTVVQPTPVVALAVSAMNDVLNAQGYTQAAWWNRIPIEAWVLMATIAICSNLLIGYGAKRRDWRILLIVPIVVSIAFFLISDIDSPNGGAIRVVPQNLLNLSQSVSPQ